MNPHEEDIDRVLSGLRSAEPEEGMETRILQRLASRTERQTASPWRVRLAYALGVSTVLAAVALVVVHRPHAAVPMIEKAQTVDAKPAAADASRPMVTSVSVIPPSVRPVREVSAPAVQAASAEGPEQLASDSFPAPPLPLTDQEKLLLRIAHRGDTQAAELPTPLPLGTEVAALRAGADKFFQDPTTGENQWKQIVAQQAAPN